MNEDKVLILLEGELVFLELFAVGEFYSSQFGLNQKRDLVRGECYVDFDWESNAIGLVYFFV